MMNKKYSITGKAATRNGFGDALLELGQSNESIVALCADLTGSLKMNAFQKSFPDRFFQCGIAEANMMGVAAGLSISGYIPFAGTFANFATGRVYDQIRQSIAYSGKNVKICASHAGLTLGEDGATHQILEDIGLMQMLPGMCVINPCDYNQTKQATKAIAEHDGPVYLRFGRPNWPIFMPEDEDFTIGKGIKMNDGADISIFATGHMVSMAMEAVDTLGSEGINCDLINIHTIKPLDSDIVLKSMAKTKCALIAEEHQIIGGLGSRIAQCAALHLPCPLEFVGVDDSFGESGKPMQLLEKYHLSTQTIIQKAKKVISRKK